MAKSDFFAWLERSDEEYSKRIFDSTLPKPIEALFSVPGNWFGLAPILLLGSLWMGVFLDETSERNWKLLAVAFFLTVPFLFLWCVYLFRGGNKAVGKIFGASESYAVMSPMGILLSYCLIDDPELLSLAIYPMWLWTPSLALVLIAKGSVLRKRPCAKTKFEHCIAKKHFAVLPKLLARIAADGSFPSGDAAGAMAFAIPVALAGHSGIGGLLMFLVCTGRVYFLAHHTFDTIVGSILTLLVHFLLCDLLGFGIRSLSVWHPIILQTLVLLFVRTIGKGVASRR